MTIFPVNQKCWKIYVRLDCDTLLFGDVNLTHLQQTAYNWQVIGFPGLTFQDATDLLAKEKGKKPLNIILILGYHNKKDNFKNKTAPAIDAMMLTLHKHFPHAQRMVAGISVRNVNSKDEANILLINTKLSKLLGNKYAVPLSTEEIKFAQEKDTDLVHNKETAKMVLASLDTLFI